MIVGSLASSLMFVASSTPELWSKEEMHPGHWRNLYAEACKLQEGLYGHRTHCGLMLAPGFEFHVET